MEKAPKVEGQKRLYGVGREKIIQSKEEYIMPKMKTSRAAAKRFKKTGSRKLKEK